MLIIKRSEKTETIIELLQSFFAQITKSVGIVDEKQGIMVAHSLLSSALFNIVCGCVEPTNILNVTALLESAKRQEKPFLWMTHDMNIHLSQYLRNEGLIPSGSLQGLYYKIAAQTPAYTSHPAVELLEVTTDEHFFEWCHVFAQCHGLNVDDVEVYFGSGTGEDKKFQMYIAQVYQKSIGACVLHLEGNKALLLYDSVLPMYRRQGVGSMMAIGRLKVAQEAGCEHAYAFGEHGSYAMFKSLGFKAFAKFNLHRFDNQITLGEDGG